MSDLQGGQLSSTYNEAVAALSDYTALLNDPSVELGSGASECTPGDVWFNLELSLDKSYQLDEAAINTLIPKERIKLDAFPDPPSPPLRPAPSPPPPSPPPPSPPPGLPLPATLGAAIANLDNLFAAPADDANATEANSTGGGAQLGAALDAVDQLTDMFGSLGEGVPLSDALLGSVANLVDSIVSMPSATGEEEGETDEADDDQASEAADKINAMLAAVGDAILQNMPVGAPPKTISGDEFAMTVANVAVPTFNLTDLSEPVTVELPPDDKPGAVFAPPNVNTSAIMERDASAAPAFVIPSTLNALAGDGSVMMSIVNFPDPKATLS